MTDRPVIVPIQLTALEVLFQRNPNDLICNLCYEQFSTVWHEDTKLGVGLSVCDDCAKYHGLAACDDRSHAEEFRELNRSIKWGREMRTQNGGAT